MRTRRGSGWRKRRGGPVRSGIDLRRAGFRAGLLVLLALVACRGDAPDAPAGGSPADSAGETAAAPPAQEPRSSSGMAARGPAADDRPTRPPAPERVLEGVFSPDGLRLALTWDRGAGARIYGLLAGTDSTPPEPARGLPLSPGRGAWATWSPDGLWIAYEAGGRLRRMRPDGTGDEPLPGAPEGASHPAWSPAGDRLAFVAPREAGGEPVPWTAASDGSGAAPLPVAVPGRWRAPAWHPSGSWFAAEAASAEGSAVYRLEPEEGSAVLLARGASPAFGPAGDTLWYARGDSIFRLALEEGGGAVGAGAGELVLPGASTPRLAPDGARIAFIRRTDGAEALYLLHRETGGVHRVTAEEEGRRP